MVVGNESASYRNRKGILSQNILAACNFDLQFIYVLTGWEGSAHDAKVLNDALTRSNNRFEVPEGTYIIPYQKMLCMFKIHYFIYNLMFFYLNFTL